MYHMRIRYISWHIRRVSQRITPNVSRHVLLRRSVSLTHIITYHHISVPRISKCADTHMCRISGVYHNVSHPKYHVMYHAHISLIWGLRIRTYRSSGGGWRVSGAYQTVSWVSERRASIKHISGTYQVRISICGWSVRIMHISYAYQHVSRIAYHWWTMVGYRLGRGCVSCSIVQYRVVSHRDVSEVSDTV